MKQLLLTFFAVILCYSLFFDTEPKATAVDEINYIYKVDNTPNVITIVPDTFNYLAFYTNNNYVYLPAIDYKRQSESLLKNYPE